MQICGLQGNIRGISLFAHEQEKHEVDHGVPPFRSITKVVLCALLPGFWRFFTLVLESICFLNLWMYQLKQFRGHINNNGT